MKRAQEPRRKQEWNRINPVLLLATNMEAKLERKTNYSEKISLIWSSEPVKGGHKVSLKWLKLHEHEKEMVL